MVEASIIGNRSECVGPDLFYKHDYVQVSETITWLVEYYNDQRLSCSRSTTEGLFTLWKPYLTPLTALYEYVARQFIAARKEDLARNDVEGKLSDLRSFVNRCLNLVNTSVTRALFRGRL